MPRGARHSTTLLPLPHLPHLDMRWRCGPQPQHMELRFPNIWNVLLVTRGLWVTAGTRDRLPLRAPAPPGPFHTAAPSSGGCRASPRARRSLASRRQEAEYSRRPSSAADPLPAAAPGAPAPLPYPVLAAGARRAAVRAAPGDGGGGPGRPWLRPAGSCC